MDLENMTPELDTEKMVLVHPDVNRPALQLTGFFDHFDKETSSDNRICGAAPIWTRLTDDRPAPVSMTS